MQDKKNYERFYFDVLKSKIAELPNGNVVFDDAPDVRIHASTGILGIEISRLFRHAIPDQPPPQLEEAEQRAVVRSAQRIAERIALPPLVVSVHFGVYPKLRKSDRDPLATRIAHIVADHIPPNGEFLPLENDFSDLEYFPEKIASVRILRMPQLTRQSWQSGSAGWVDCDFTADLQNRIDAKNDRLTDYLTKCDRCWLVVGADWEGESSFYEFSAKMQSHQFDSVFDRTFFIDGFTKDAYELQPLKSYVGPAGPADARYAVLPVSQRY